MLWEPRGKLAYPGHLEGGIVNEDWSLVATLVDQALGEGFRWIRPG